jgi:integrase
MTVRRHDLSPSTQRLYESLLDLHILPTFGTHPVGRIPPTDVRSWNALLSERHPVVAAKAYRLLRQILATAVADELIARNPCLVRGAGQEVSPERPIASVAEVDALADAMPETLRISVLLASWCQLRRAEVLGLERRDFDLLHGTVRIERTANHVKGAPLLGPPKSAAGMRTITIPPHLITTVAGHLDAHVGAGPDAPILAGDLGRRIRPSTLHQAWNRARTSVGRPDLRFHDLRHSGATWVAISGATTREVMARVGHSSSAAALRYQHATEDRDTVLAEALSGMATPVPIGPLSGQRGISAG